MKTAHTRFIFTLMLGMSLAALALFAARWQTGLAAPIVEPPVHSQPVAIRYVAKTGSDATDCTNSASPCATIQYAVDQAVAGDEVRVASGEYTDVHARVEFDPSPPNETLTQTAFITQPLTLRGGYTLTNWIVSDPLANPTTVNPQGQGRGIVVMTTQGVTIEGFRVVGGDATVDGYLSTEGGGIGVFYSEAVINDCYLEGNVGHGGIGMDNSTAILHGNVITGHLNSGVLGLYSTVTMTQNIVSANTGSIGGGVYLQESNTYVAENTVVNNTAANLGGGIYIFNGARAMVIGNIITNNTVNNNGGGMFLVSQGIIEIDGNTFEGNSSGDQGGGLFFGGTEATFNNNLVANNSAAWEGGGVYVNGGSFTLSNNEIRGNYSDWDGGGISFAGNQITLTENSIISNTARALGGGILVNASGSGSTNLTNNIVADNHIVEAFPLYDGSGIYLQGGTAKLLHNTVANNHGGEDSGVFVRDGTFTMTNNIIISHTVGLEVYSNGTVQTEATLWGNDVDWMVTNGTLTTGTINLWGNPGFINPANNDYHIGLNSVAINAGIDAGVTTDIDGDTRPYGLGFDIGADELSGLLRYVATTGSDTSDCTNSANPCATIQYAVDQAVAGDEVRVASGEYTDVHARVEHDPSPPNETLTQTVFITQPLILRGGYTLTDWAVSDPLANPTTVNPQGQGRGIVVMTTQGVTIEGFRVVGGDATVDGYLSTEGGGIGVFYSEAVINHCYLEGNVGHGGVGMDNSTAIVHGNVITGHLNSGVLGLYSTITMTQNIVSGNTGSDGGGVSVGLSNIYLSENTITGNTASDHGGGLSVSNITGTTVITGNTISGNSGGYGGGVNILQIGVGSVTIENNIISDNDADFVGGGLLLFGEGVILTGNFIYGNHANTNGGGVAGHFLVLMNNQIVGNTASQQGGGIYSAGVFLAPTWLDLISNTLSDNSALEGGGIYASYAYPLNMTGNVITGNSAYYGGALLAENSQVSIYQNTIANNTADIAGGGIHVSETSGEIVNNVMANNQVIQGGPGAEGGGLYASLSDLDYHHNTLVDNNGGSGIGVQVTNTSTLNLLNNILISHTVGISVSANSMAHLDATLWGNGTDWAGDGTITTGTINLYGDPSFADPANGNYHLNPDSIAIDAGIDAGVTTDIDGDSRPFEIGYDIGADEFVGVVSGPIRYVATTGSDTTSCVNSDYPCATIQYAVDQADAGNEIRVAAGTYTGVNNQGGLSQLVYISKTITMRGGYTVTNWTASNPVTNLTTLDAEGQGRVIAVMGALDVTLDGLKLTGGFPISNESGGGLYGEQCSLFVQNSEFFGNEGAADGGGMAIFNCMAILSNNVFTNNIAVDDGGGVHIGNNSYAVVQNNHFQNNFASDGGGMDVESSTVVLLANTIFSNTATGWGGGGLHLLESDAILSGNWIAHNSAETAIIGGGGIYVDVGSQLTSTNDIIANNTASMNGGGLVINSSNPTQVIHDTLVGNSAGDGSAIFNINGQLWITNTMLVSHTLGLNLYAGSSASLEATLWNNDTNWAGDGTITTGTVNLYGDPSFTDPANGNYHLNPDSIAIDAGIDGGISTDIDGEFRPFEAWFDIGADEFVGELSGPVRYVATTGSDTTSCVNPDFPCATVQYALHQADAGNEIRVAAGTYTGVNNQGGLSQMVYISKTITVRGGYTITNWTESDPVANPTMLDAEGQGRVFYIIGAANSMLDGLQITGGLASSGGDGGGLFGYQCSLTIQNSQFFGNQASTDGGGVYLLECPTTFEGNLFTNNSAGDDGGGMNVDYSDLLLFNNDFSGNFASDGGGLYLLHANTRAEGNIISGNTVNGWGGGIRLDVGSWFTATNNFIVDNQASTGTGLLMDTNQPVHLIHNTIANNSGGDGTGIFSISSNLWLTNTILVSHTVGVYAYDGTTAHLEATLWGNGSNTAGNGTIMTGTRNLYGPPAFLDPLNGDYHLSPYSMAVDAGVDAGVLTDIDGEPRPIGLDFDLGADELTGEAFVQLSHQAHASEIIAGDTIHFTIWVTNTGTIPLNAHLMQTLWLTPDLVYIYSWEAFILPGEVWTQTNNVASSFSYSGTISSDVSLSVYEHELATVGLTITASFPPEPEPAIEVYLPLVLNKP